MILDYAVTAFLVCLGLYATALLVFLTWTAVGRLPKPMVDFLAAHEKWRGR